MNNQEAIETLKANYPDACYEQLREAVDMAISTLEKQIPKKPIFSETLVSLYCPVCTNWIGIENNRLKYGDMYNRFNETICPYCGQKIELNEDGKYDKF